MSVEEGSVKPGNKIGGFTVFQVLEKEIILGADDKNMDFRLSVLIDENTDEAGAYRIIEFTTVKYNTWLGNR